MKTKILACFTLFLVALFLVLNLAFPLKLPNLHTSSTLYDKNGLIIREKLSLKDEWLFEADVIPPLIKKSVLHFEDKYFYYHFGINPFSIIRASFHNFVSPNKIGASTITMQVARMIEPKERNYKNKIIEIFRAVQLELNYSKDEILSMYFSLAPYGGNIVGIKAASRFYFNKTLDELSLGEIALLSVVPKNPNKNRLDRSRNLNHLKDRVLTSLYKSKIIDESMYRRALNESFKPKRYEALSLAYHYSNLAFENGEKMGLNFGEITSNLDLNLQLEIEKITRNLMLGFSKFDINNASVVVIDNEKMEVIAYLGSHNLKSDEGFNDGVMTKRSVGSTLKPFIYALALESGLITPKQKLIDTEIFINDYSPQNFTKEFIGEISAIDALTLSLNTPAVFLNSKLGENSLYELLSKANLAKEKKEFYGEAIALGSINLSLLELTHLFTIFANEGVLKPLEVAGKIVGEEIKLLEKESSYLVGEMLKESPRSYLNSVWQNTFDMPVISFKTGTSANSVDLHTIAFNKNYTVGVWLGNFSGKPTSGLTGLESSAKIVFEVFRYLSKNYNLNSVKKPDGLMEAKICTDAFIYDECKSYETDTLIQNVTLKDRCNLISNEQIHYLFINGFIDKDDIINSPCFETFKHIRPLIAYPADGSQIVSFDSIINVKCISFLGDEIYLKINEEEYNKHRSGENLKFSLDYGYHTIKCLDENSNLATSKIQIRSFE